MGARPAGYAHCTDAELLRRSAREPQAFGALYDRHAPSLLAFFQRRTACPETVADLTAETFAAAFLARRRFRDTGAPAAAWLYGIARHKLGDSLRRQRIEDRARRRLGVERVALDDDALTRIEELADLKPMLSELERALDDLSPDAAEAVRLRVENDLPYSEVARRQGCSVGAARVRVARALTKLAEALEAST
jgi:RNA polymerase sigma factor (sigma-70 family)